MKESDEMFKRAKITKAVRKISGLTPVQRLMLAKSLAKDNALLKAHKNHKKARK